ncbi:hypothetical protein HYPSUDRAFT_44832 [Hypholoma sublateritium FD-334 SS-4]|uniref:Uncharacterized protein n=1 Tax=Hypholoma sublateritium (strain FD-334 SS-4) TaxID=945553 RepID=A0A0D2NIX8_HYPSF|nr:hypothetical protein HYPSUDRAFT_44832 [Hypholoma sublateritium FD-334 SS-4]
MGTITITDASGASGIQSFVSKYTNASNGSDNWYDINTSAQSWSRGPGWELVAFSSTANSQRRGWYVHIPQGKTLNITFYGFDRDIGLQYV